MKYALSLVIASVQCVILVGIYMFNESFVTTIACYCLGICMGRIAFKIANWLHKNIFKDKEDK